MLVHFLMPILSPLVAFEKCALKRVALRPQPLGRRVLYFAQFLLQTFLLLLLHTRIRYLLCPRLLALLSDELVDFLLNLLDFGQFADLCILFFL